MRKKPTAMPYTLYQSHWTILSKLDNEIISKIHNRPEYEYMQIEPWIKNALAQTLYNLKVNIIREMNKSMRLTNSMRNQR